MADYIKTISYINAEKDRIQETTYTTYAPDSDITFIMKDVFENGKLIATKVTGFYFGEPDDEMTRKSEGSLQATYDLPMEN